MIPRETLFDPTPALPPPPPPSTALPHETFRPEPSEDEEPFVSRRQDGWSATNQRGFLEALAEGHGVEFACRRVGLSTASAYAFRRTAKGSAFALGWRAASLIARDSIAETLLVRALEGQVDTYIRADGTQVTRHRHDNRLAMSLLARLDRQVESAPDPDVKAARLVAQEFDAYLDLVTRDEGPARAGLFLARRSTGLTDDTENAADLAPIYALAAADRLVRTGVATAGEVPVDDLDPTRRAEWTAEQWSRAEAAGLLRLAVPQPEPDPEPEAETQPEPQLPQHSRSSGSPFGDAIADPEDPDAPPLVWWDAADGQWRTRFPPPDDFEYDEDRDDDGEPGEEGYWRTLTQDEEAAIGLPPRCESQSFDALEARREGFFEDIYARGGIPARSGSLFSEGAPI
ncbi:hypothetical protein [Sphingomonas radiodurans]|uniref:hypothetical protein n=1 Tax=Sphingomonas radiodurans TaxID=2890321 RepID=UPI001E2B75CD|nr:hypothetical protein [Sphingomonas radiodurans]WBH17460.1 hypothetical protein LLW23_04960 [Sphingomonas radiodurans]